MLGIEKEEQRMFRKIKAMIELYKELSKNPITKESIEQAYAEWD